MNLPGTRRDHRLLDETAFEHALAEGDQPLKVFRDALQQGAANLQIHFKNGVPVDVLVAARASLIDMLLRHAWQSHLSPDAEAALVAVGGYGRAELHPGSDVDLMILLEPGGGKPWHEAIERLLTFLWDIGLEVGQSVRTVDDCVHEAEQDVTVATNLMESRWLAGSRELYKAMLEATGPDKIWPSDRFFEAKLKEQRLRHHKFDDAYSQLEPNIKESPGGLRDIQTIEWVAKRHFGARTMHDLVEHEFLTESEYQSLRDGQCYLWRVRIALHLMTGRREDRLLFDYQRTLASEFGHLDDARNLAVEQFMQRYYRTVMELVRLNEMLLQLFQEAILYQLQSAPPRPINKRFQACGRFIEVTRDDIFLHYPFALLEVFLLLQRHPELEGVRASTIRLIRDHCHLIDDDFRNDIRAISLFMEILRNPRGVTHELRRMNRYGVLAAYIPAFGNIVGRMQYDLFHVYTVDEHTLFVLRNLRSFMVPEHRDEFPLCSDIALSLPKPELLYLAALFHDIAKGRGGDHSQLGAADARDFCRQHYLSEFDSNLVAWLVKKHLIMSMTAQRRDISDPDEIQEFAAEVGDITRLNYLYLLTVADFRATNPLRWNQWKDSLLRELYGAARRALLRGLDNPQAQDELIEHKQNEAAYLLGQAGYQRNQYLLRWTTFSIHYFLTHSPEEIAWQTQLVLQADPDSLPLVALRSQANRGGTEIFTYTPDRLGIFATTTAVLDQLGLNIVAARILTTDDAQSLNTYTVLEADGRPVAGQERGEEIRNAIVNGLRNRTWEEIKVSRRIPRQQKHFDIPTRITFSEDKANNRTIMRLVCNDRPGLLAEVGYTFAHCGIQLIGAKISTIGVEVEDVFFVTDMENCALSDQEQYDCLHRTIHERLSSNRTQS